MQPILQKEARRRADARAAGPLTAGILQVSRHARYNVPLFARALRCHKTNLSRFARGSPGFDLASRLPHGFAVFLCSLFVRHPKEAQRNIAFLWLRSRFVTPSREHGTGGSCVPLAFFTITQFAINKN